MPNARNGAPCYWNTSPDKLSMISLSPTASAGKPYLPVYRKPARKTD